MKIAVKISVFVISILLVMFIQMALISRNSRTTETEKALTSAVEQTLKQLVEDDSEYVDYQALIADFNKRLLLQINSDSDVCVEVLEADIDKGILDIQIKERYKSMRGNEKEYVYRKTVFLEEFTNNLDKSYRIICFRVGDSIYSQYTRYDGSNLINPDIPKMEGQIFQYWQLKGGGKVENIEEITVNGDMEFTAVFQ